MSRPWARPYLNSRARILIFSLIAMASIGACGHDQDCARLGLAYADEIHGVALACDPTSADPCGAQLPTIVYEQQSDGGVRFGGPSSNFGHAVDPNRVTKAPEVLQRYLSAGCKDF